MENKNKLGTAWCHSPGRYLFRLVVFALITAMSSAFASDGSLEINQTCAVETGCFPGDTAGFPVTITEPGSYRLTGNLRTRSGSVTGISIATADVTIDLGGFVVACELGNIQPTACSSGTAPGIAALDQGQDHRITVVNGMIKGLGAGLRLYRNSVVRDVRASNNRGTGIGVTAGSIVARSISSNNGTGISAASSIISGCTVIENTGIGIFTSNESVIENSLIRDNGGIGIDADFNAKIIGNNVRDNNGYGIDVTNYSAVLHNVVTQNSSGGIKCIDGCTISSNTVAQNSGHGIETNAGNTISNNTISKNTGFGIRAIASSTIIDNNVYNNAGNGIGGYGGSLVQRNTVRDNDGVGLDLSINSAYRGNVVIDNDNTSPFNQVLNGVNRGDNYCHRAPAAATFCP